MSTPTTPTFDVLGISNALVDVLSNDDPPQGVGWDRSTVCLLVSSGCVRDYSASGFAWHVDPDDGTITVSGPAPAGM